MPPPSRMYVLPAVVGATFPLMAYAVYRICTHTRTPSLLGAEPSIWSCDQVVAWLRSNGVRAETVRAFVAGHIDGKALLELADDTDVLQHMGVCSRDARIISAALADLRHPRRNSLAPTSTTAGRNELHAFLDRSSALFEALSASVPSNVPLAPRLYELLDAFQAMSADDQRAAMLPLARQLSAVMSHTGQHAPAAPLDTRRALSSVPAERQIPDVPPEQLAMLVEKLRPLCAMVDNFEGLLKSDALQGVSAEEFEEVAVGVEKQLQRVMLVAERLPAEVAGDLRDKCAVVAELLAAKRAELHGVARPQTKEKQPPPQPTSMASLMARLRVLFDKVKDPAILEASPQSRMAAVDAMVAEAQSIAAAVSGMQDEGQAAMVAEVARNVLALLEQVQHITRDELAMGHMESAASTTEATVPPPPQSQTTEADMSSIVKAVQELLEVLQSPQFAAAPPSVRNAMSARLRERISELTEAVSVLPAPDRDVLLEVLVGASALLEDDGEGAEKEGQKTGEANVQQKVDAAVEQVEQIFNHVNSDAFEAAPAEQKRILLSQFLERVEAIKHTTLKNFPENDSVMNDLIRPLEGLLRQRAKVLGPSEHFVSIVETIEGVQEMLSSPMFRNATDAKKEGIARSVIPQLQRITSTFSGLLPDERAQADAMMRPINAVLIRIAQRDSGDRKEGEGEDEEVEEEDEEKAQARPASTLQEAAVMEEVISRLRAVMTLVQSDAFTSASDEDRARMVVTSVRTLEALKVRCETIDPALSGTFLPLIERLLSQLHSLVRAPGDETEQEATHANGNEGSQPSGAERSSLFSSVSQITKDLREGREEGKLNLGADEVRSLSGLLDIVDGVHDLTAEEQQIRGDFVSELRLAATGGDDEDVDEEDTETMNIDSFLECFSTIADSLFSKTITSASQLVPYMTVTERTLKKADADAVLWRGNKDAVRLVGSVLSKIQESQTNLQETGAGSEVSRVLLSAAETLREHPPKSPSDLVPYIDIIGAALDSEDGITMENLEAFKVLQDAVVAAKDALDAGTGDAEKSTEDGSTAPQSALDERIASALLEISDKLRDGLLSEEELSQIETVVNQIANAVKDPAFMEAIASIREQIKLQRISNGEDISSEADATSMEKDEAGKTGTEESQEEKVYEEDDADSATDVSLPPHSHTNALLTHEGDVALLPKIESRVINMKTPEFVASSTLFDLQCISKILLHLSQYAKKKDDVTLRQRVEGLKGKFVEQLAAFHKADHPSEEAQPSSALRVNAENVQDAEGMPAHVLTVFTAEEADNYPLNEELMRKLTSDNKAFKAAVATPEEIASWEGKSTTLLVYTARDNTKDTSMSELCLLEEYLRTRYGFSVITLIDPALTAESLASAIAAAVSQNPTRLLVYYHTPVAHSDVVVPHAASFHDGSVLEHQRVLELAEKVERTVVVQSLPRQLEVKCCLRSEVAPAMVVRLTSKSAQELSKLRCWLFDGIFTPVVLELLCRDERTVLCPEDVAHYAATAVTRENLNFGSQLASAAAAMAFFVPLDDVQEYHSDSSS